MSILGMMGARHRLRDVVEVTEERGKWVKGKLTADPSVAIEVSFEVSEFEAVRFPGTFITYFGAWRAKQTVFEFSLGQLVFTPSSDDYDRLIAPVVLAFGTYRPMSVEDAINHSLRSS